MRVQEAMRAAERKSTEECPVKMKLVAPPLYVLTTNVRAPPAKLVPIGITQRHPLVLLWLLLLSTAGGLLQAATAPENHRGGEKV